jgi:IclR family mhp operon transcriptional activator
MSGTGSAPTAALSRGLALLRLLAAADGLSLAQAARAAGLAKSTARRLLRTLESAGFARLSVADGLWRANPLPGFRAPADARAALALAAAPVLQAMARETPFPSDVMIRDGTMMETVENNRRFSPLALHHSMIGERVNIPWTAVGRAYLAWCPEAERDEILELLGHSAEAERFDRGALLTELRATRARGYGVRHARFVGGTERDPRGADHLDAIAVAIPAGERVAGCINLMWPLRMRLEPGFRERQLSILRAAAGRIGAAIQAE